MYGLSMSDNSEFRLVLIICSLLYWGCSRDEKSYRSAVFQNYSIYQSLRKLLSKIKLKDDMQ
ncbi:hypothetical protein T4D_11538 [Trichinella pseudospiralis]|uniref:Uncharacterized protein n=1 Tax=Trichinella pseudospiralis TaxID=6337 RepID=A0A0V1F8K1_TRIPS|nr:hypothetical protein T4D_11538 [Trichinella pseudospiralis]